jgi:hypothetical protein
LPGHRIEGGRPTSPSRAAISFTWVILSLKEKGTFLEREWS